MLYLTIRNIVLYTIAIEYIQILNDDKKEPEIRRSARARIAKIYGPQLYLYLVVGSRDEMTKSVPIILNIDFDPETFEEAMKSRDSSFWNEAIREEMDLIMGNRMWKLVDLPQGCKPFESKWIFKRKLKVDGTVEKFKVRLVAKGFSQNEGVVVFDTYIPVTRIANN